MPFRSEFLLPYDGELISWKSVGAWRSGNHTETKLVSVHVIVNTMHGADNIKMFNLFE